MAKKQFSQEEYKEKRNNYDIPFDADSIPSLKDNDEATDLDVPLKEKSEIAYMRIAEGIVETSKVQLDKQNKSKNKLKQDFTKFFIRFISIQYVVMVLLFVVKAIWRDAGPDTSVIIAYITSVFVETLGAIILMVTYAFDSSQEVKILEILNGVIRNFQKFKD